MTPEIIAIDGPSASGKSSVAKRIARALNRLYVDSGALYRAVTWRCLAAACDLEQNAAIIAVLGRLDMKFSVADCAVGFSVDGLVPGDAIRTQLVSNHVSRVASVPEVRQQVNTWIRSMTSLGALVVEGRDIGSAVFPDATYKFYLDASPAERASRRFKELATQNETVQVSDIEASLARRDRLDTTRQADPLRIPDGAIIVDSTGLTLDAVVESLLQHIPRPA